MPPLSATRRNCSLISSSAFLSARMLILLRSWASISTSPSVIPTRRVWHSAASRVGRTGCGATEKSEGHIFMAPARHTAAIFSETPSNSSGASPIPRTHASLAISG
jgi:hypothetical protein